VKQMAIKQKRHAGRGGLLFPEGGSSRGRGVRGIMIIYPWKRPGVSGKRVLRKGMTNVKEKDLVLRGRLCKEGRTSPDSLEGGGLISGADAESEGWDSRKQGVRRARVV